MLLTWLLESTGTSDFVIMYNRSVQCRQNYEVHHSRIILHFVLQMCDRV